MLENYIDQEKISLIFLRKISLKIWRAIIKKRTLIFYSSVKNQILLVYVNNNFILFVKCINR
jgi:hypothetical protein